MKVFNHFKTILTRHFTGIAALNILQIQNLDGNADVN